MDRIIYTKYSNERDTRLRIKTHIRESEKQRYILKLPMTDAAQLHIDSIYNMYNMLTELYSGTSIKINKCIPYDKGIRFEFLDGITFEEILDEHLARKDYLGIIDLIREYKSKLLDRISTKQFIPTEGFNRVFGNVDLNKSLEAVSVANIDLIFSNIIVDKDNEWNIIDYEWTFAFEVPINFILYRALCDYLYRSNKRDELWHLELLQLFGIDEGEKKLYQEMDRAFHKYVSGDTSSLAQINESVNNTKYVVKDLLTTYIPGQVQVFYDYGEGFSEDNSEFVNCLKDEQGMYKLSINRLDNVKSVRIDPTNQCCLARISDFKIKKSEYSQNDEIIENTFFNNGVEIGESLFAYNTDDPQWVLTEIDDTFTEINISFSLSCVSPEMIGICIEEYKKQNDEVAKLVKQNDEIPKLIKLNEDFLQREQQMNIELDNRLVELEHRQEEINNRDRIIIDQNRQINEKDIELDNRLVELDNRMNVINDRDTLICEMKNQLHEKDIELDNRLKELDNRMNVINDKERTIRELSDENHKLRLLIEGYNNSTSWKLTKPIRQVGNIIKK